jgi:Family of unknown function (DUF6112)
VPGISELQDIVGALLTIGLVAALAGPAVAIAAWAIGSHSTNPVLAGWGQDRGFDNSAIMLAPS